LWGVGFLPRRWQAGYVRWRRDASYENIKTLSYRELKFLSKKHLSVKKFALPEVAPAVLKEFSLGMRVQINAYRLLKKLPPFSFLFKWVGPGWDVIFQKDF
jgi:hypothetical protein